MGPAARLTTACRRAIINLGDQSNRCWRIHHREDCDTLYDDSESVERAFERAWIANGDVTVYTLRHTALPRMIEHDLDDHIRHKTFPPIPYKTKSRPKTTFPNERGLPTEAG
jgi:hypothetical protein